MSLQQQRIKVHTETILVRQLSSSINQLSKLAQLMASQQQSLLPLLSLHPQSINLEQLLLTLCKPNSSPPQIDFLNLPQVLEKINEFHQRTCQQIVEFVDAHCQEYLAMNHSFQLLEGTVQKVQTIVKEVAIRLGDYAKVYYNSEGNVQELITNYELSILQQVLLNQSLHMTTFLTQFVGAFQHIAIKPYTVLSFTERHFLIKFCRYFHNIASILNHHIVQQAVPDAVKIVEMAVNLVDQVEFYLSEQLQRVVGAGVKKDIKHCVSKQNTNQLNNSQSTINKLHPPTKTSHSLLLKQLRICYSYLNKLPQYYRLIQQHLISLEIQTAQKNLISQKINLIGGKGVEFVQQYFKSVFNVFHHLPVDYPKERVLELIFTQLRKTEIKFIYTYTLPIFPISYNCYLGEINRLKGQELNDIRVILSKNHNWDLRRWVDVREKNIIDRCTKDWDKCLQTYYQKDNKAKQQQLQQQSTSTSLLPPPDLIKWLDIIFKENCKIDGVKNLIVSLSLKVVGKYAQIIQKSLNDMQLLPDFINVYVKACGQVEEVMGKKLCFFYDQVSNPNTNSNKQQLQLLIDNIARSCQKILHKAIQKSILANTKLLSKSCCGCLQPYKQFIMKVIKPSKQLSQSHSVNSSFLLFKPLQSYMQNSPRFSSQVKETINSMVVNEVMRYYDEVYVTEIYQYARVNLSVEQLAEVMAVVGNQRTVLFQSQKVNE